MNYNNFAIITTPSLAKVKNSIKNMISLDSMAELENVLKNLKKQKIKNVIILSSNEKEDSIIQKYFSKKIIGIDLHVSKFTSEFYMQQVERYMQAKLSFEQIITNLSMSVKSALYE